MTKVNAANEYISVSAYRGDAKTLIAFDLLTEAGRENLAGFTVQITPPGKDPYFLQNDLRFENPGLHAQDPNESSFSTINAPIHKFRWVHVPGVVHQGLKPAFGIYNYAVTPRYFHSAVLLPLDVNLAALVSIEVAPFVKGSLSLGFTRGFTQSQAFVNHFGLKALIKPKDAPLQFDTSVISGTNAKGEKFTFEQEYEWLGFTARDRIYELLDRVIKQPALTIDAFIYDLNEPEIVRALLEVGKEGRARIILDNAPLHHSMSKQLPEDEFETLFAAASGASTIKRGHFSRYSHDKVFVLYEEKAPIAVLTGSTNFSVTGLYVNSNHVIVFNDATVAQTYADVFQQAWDDDVHTAPFIKSPLANKRFLLGNDANLPPIDASFSPHTEEFARQILGGIVQRAEQEKDVPDGRGSVLFAVMQLDGAADNPVYDALLKLHESQSVFSFGISDSSDGISLYPVGSAKGVLVTGKPVNTQLPPPFNQVPNIGGVGHQVHHKFVVCGFNGENPVVYCGSSNLALKGEQVNGDNLLAIHDGDVATAFAIEALALVDHFNFLDGVAKGPASKTTAGTQKALPVAAIKQQAAVSAGWFLGTTDTWVHKFYDPQDLHFKDRELFAG